MKQIFTIGYEGSDISDFIDTLVDAGVKVLADVRQVTVSRKRGFSKNSLRERLALSGIQYFAARELGDPKPGRLAARRGEYHEFRKIYGEHIASTSAQAALARLAGVARAENTCLMCYERDPTTCHRLIVAQHLEKYRLIPFNLFIDGSHHARESQNMPGDNLSESLAAAE